MSWPSAIVDGWRAKGLLLDEKDSSRMGKVLYAILEYFWLFVLP